MTQPKPGDREEGYCERGLHWVYSDVKGVMPVAQMPGGMWFCGPCRDKFAKRCGPCDGAGYRAPTHFGQDASVCAVCDGTGVDPAFPVKVKARQKRLRT